MLAARISGDRFAMFVPETSVDATHDIADNLRQSFERLGVPARAPAGRSHRELRRRQRRRGQPSAVARARLGRDRLQGRQGPRPQPRRDLLRRRPEHRPPLHRPHAHRHGALGAARPALPARGADHRAAERRAGHAEVRAAAAHERRNRRQRAAGEIPVGGRALPARAGHRPLGRAAHDRDADAACGAAARACRPASPSTSPGSRSATRSSRCSWTRRCARASCRAGCCRSRSPRRRRSPTSCAPRR